MLLVDTSVWIDHLRQGDAALSQALQSSRVLSHPWIVGEISLGNLKNRQQVLNAMQSLPRAILADAAEVIALIESAGLYGKGLGFADAALLASVRLTPQALLWTRDKRLHAMALSMGAAAIEAH
ncbi:MAG: type II toxin-antitoxin system VapC family toxin [Hydrogenophaga sp.]